MTLQEAQKQIAIKYKLGTILVTGHKATYFNEASELYASSREEAAFNAAREMHGNKGMSSYEYSTFKDYKNKTGL